MVLAYNLARNEWVKVNAGFLIVRTFVRLYADWQARYDLRRDVYAIPRVDRRPEESPIQYRGLDRSALDDYDGSQDSAEVLLALKALENQSVNGMVFTQADADEVYAQLGPLQSDYEIVWTRIAGSRIAPPDGFVSAGFESTYFASDHFSASCDCMMFPHAHGTDEEGELFLEHFRRLNKYGMFDCAEAAQAFLDYYRSFDWTETGDYVIAEVFIRQTI